MMPKKTKKVIKKTTSKKPLKPAPKKTVKPAQKKVAVAPKKVVKPVRTATRAPSKIKKPKSKKSIKELESKLGRKVAKPQPKVIKKLTRSERLKLADNKLSKRTIRQKSNKAPKLAITPVTDMRQKFLNESESKEVKAVADALKRRLQKVTTFANKMDTPAGIANIEHAISSTFNFNPRLNQIEINRAAVKELSHKQKLHKIDEGEDEDSQVQSSSNYVTAARPKAEQLKVDQGYVAREIKNLNLRAGSKAVFSDSLDPLKHMFGGKERALVTFANVGKIQDTKYLNPKGKLEHAYYGTVLQTPVFDNAGEWQKLVDLIASKTGMRYVPQIKPKHVMSTAILRQLADSPAEFKFFKKNSGTYAFFMHIDNDVVYGCYVAYAPSVPATAAGNDAVPAGFIFGYWCGIGMTIPEMRTLTMGRFDEHFDAPNPDTRTTQFIGQSMLTQFFNARNRSLQISVADISLTRDHGIDKDAQDFIGKSESGSILYVPNVDLRDRFEDWVEDRILPDELSNEDYVPGTNLTEKEYFAGRVVYTDMKNKIMFYYTKSGDLHKFDFSSAAELNTRDKAEITKAKSFDPDDIKANRDTQSFYGTSFLFGESDYEVVVGYNTSKSTFDQLSDFKFQGYREDPWGAQAHSLNKSSKIIFVTLEGLRESYQGDKKFYGLVENYYDELSISAAYYYSQGHRDVIPKDETDKEQEAGRFTDAALRRAPMIGMMLSIAKKSYEEWPHENDLRTKANDQLRKMTAPSREDLDAVVGSFNGLIKDKNGNYPRLMPHQVETLAVMRNTNTAALDVDMGGGKTIMAVLDITRLISEGITLEDGSKVACRPLVVMPGSRLIRNYIDDVKKFFGTNMNIFVLETDQTVKNAVSANELVERMKNAPANTVFVTTYSWITGGGAYDITLNTELNKKSGELKVVSKRVFPRVEMLKRVPITAVYLDESHKIKNKTSKQNAAAVAMSDIPVRRLLTGTMVSKDATDIFQQMRFLDSTLIGSEARFLAQYGAKDEDSDDDGGKKKKAKRGDLRPGAEKEARAEMRANGVLQLRRSSWMPLLPEKEEKFFFVDMSKEHEAVYKSMLTKLVATPLKAYEKGLITYEQYEFLTKLNSVLNINAEDDDDSSLLSGRAGALLSEDESEDEKSEDTDSEDQVGNIKKGRRGQADAMVKVQQNMAVMMAAMQDFLTAPELLDPKTFDSDPGVMEALRNAGLVEEDGTMIGFSIGPKDELVKKIIIDHFAKTGGKYIKRSEQDKRFGSDKSKYAGKVIIFHYNVNAATHFYNTLKAAGIKGVGMYQADSNLHKASEGHLNAFKDPENEDVAVLCAAEGAILLGQNMQSADTVIRCSTPWTTGDYDQSIARAFRNGQDLEVTAVNIQVNASFEVLKLIKLFVRESSNRKLNSDFDVPFEISKKLAECSLENHVEYATEDALRHFPVNRYNVPSRPQAGMYEDSADLFSELHEEIWKQEKLAAYGPDEKKCRARDPEYLRDPKNRCEASRYFKLGLDQMTEMATGSEEVKPVSLEVSPKNSNGEPVTVGQLGTDDLDALFNGFIHPDDRPHLKKLRYQDIRKRIGNVDPGNVLRNHIEDAFDAMVEAKPSYAKLYAPRKDEICNELYSDFTDTQGRKSKDFKLFAYVGLHEPFIKGIYNMVASRYKNLDLAELEIGKNADLKMNVKRTSDNAKKLAGIIDSFRKVNGIPEGAEPEIEEELEEEAITETKKSGRKELPVEEEEIVRDVLVVGLSKYFSDFSESATDDDAQLMLFAPISQANPLAKKLPSFHLPSGKTFAKRIRYVYTRTPITSTLQIKNVLQKIEAAGGLIEAKNENGRYNLVDSQILKALFSSKAPSTKQADAEHSIHNLMRDKAHVVGAKVAGKKKQNIDCGFIVLDGKITLAAFPDADKANFNAQEESILRTCGFKRIEYMVVMYKVTEPQKKKLQKDLIALATRFNSDGVEFFNEKRFEKHLRFFTKTQVSFESERS
jgi:SNF2 family DNA or RNA helicase